MSPQYVVTDQLMPHLVSHSYLHALYRLSLPFWGVSGFAKVRPGWPKTDMLEKYNIQRHEIIITSAFYDMIIQ